MGDTNRLSSTSQPQTATSEFVKKLFKILEDPAVYPIISWGAKGDCFVVKDVNNFSKKILPPVYNHSNFASFVRQLNKYDFHKIRNPDDGTSGSDSWAFYHPDFRANGRDTLYKIKRKAPPSRAAVDEQQCEVGGATGLSYSSPISPSSLHPGMEELSTEVQRLRGDNEDLDTRLRIMEREHRGVLVTLGDFQTAIAEQNELIHSMNACAVGNCLQQSPLTLEYRYTSREVSHLASPQQAQCQVSPAYYADTQQSRYNSRSGASGVSSSGPSNTPGAIYTSQYPARGDAPIQGGVQLASTGLPASHPSSPWNLSATTIYSPPSQAMGHRMSAMPLSPISPGGTQELVGLATMGMSGGGQSEAGEDASPYFMWSSR